jgi:N-acetylneuraminic acid mutarotase
VVQDFQVFDFEKSWLEIKASNGPPKSYAHKAVSDDDCMFVYGGYDYKTTFYQDLYQFHYKSKQWSIVQTKGSSPGSRLHHQMCHINGEIFLHGGLKKYEYSSIVSDLHMFDIATSTWKSIVTENPLLRSYTSMIPISSNLIYLFGGWNGYFNEKGSFIYNVSLGKWTAIENVDSFPGERFSMSTVIYKNFIYLLGGKNNQVGYNDLYKCFYQMENEKFKIKSLLQKHKSIDLNFLFV